MKYLSGLIYLFGGNDGGKDLNTIWQYEIKKNKWRLLDIRMPFKLSGFGSFIDPQEKYILFFGGESNKKLRNDILIFDTTYTSFKMSSIKCPEAGKCDAVLMQNGSIHLFDANGTHWMTAKKNNLQTIITAKMTNLAATYSNSDDDEEEKIDIETKDENPGAMMVNDVEMKSEQNENELVNKNELVQMHLDKALEEINRALLIVKENGNDGNKQDIDFTGNLAKIQSSIDRLMQFKSVDILQYKTWGLDQMMLWISQIENGRFCKYIEVLKNGFIAQNIENGAELPDINSLMLKKPPFNIQNGKDRDDLISYFNSLSNGGNVDNIGVFGGTVGANEGGGGIVNNYQAEGAGGTGGGGGDVFV